MLETIHVQLIKRNLSPVDKSALRMLNIEAIVKVDGEWYWTKEIEDLLDSYEEKNNEENK